MASDVDDLTNYYASLPSIFENESTSKTSEILVDLSTNSSIDSEKSSSYQPMFGTFLFADSEPLTRAAFVASVPSSSMDIQSTLPDQQQIESQMRKSPTPPIASIENLTDDDVDDDVEDEDEEDDFDGIPIRHAPNLIKMKSNGDIDRNSSTSEQQQQQQIIQQLVQHLEHNGDTMNHSDMDDDDEETFLNGFDDDQHHEAIIGGSGATGATLFKDIPDIDDLNEHDDFDDDQIPIDRMDMLDQSDSIRSASPDSLLSSSHLRDEDDDDDDDVNDEDDDEDDVNLMAMNRFDNDHDLHDDNNNRNHHHDEEDDQDDDDEDDVTQWNDDFLLGKTSVQVDRPNAPSPPPLVSFHSHPHDQVDFIDSSRSASRCSNASSHLSVGYTDQARIFTNDDDMMTSSDSEFDDDHPIENLHPHRSDPDLNQINHIEIHDTNDLLPVHLAIHEHDDDDDDNNDDDDDRYFFTS